MAGQPGGALTVAHTTNKTTPGVLKERTLNKYVWYSIESYCTRTATCQNSVEF